jgi:hypothetical protein
VFLTEFKTVSYVIRWGKKHNNGTLLNNTFRNGLTATTFTEEGTSRDNTSDVHGFRSGGTANLKSTVFSFSHFRQTSGGKYYPSAFHEGM